MHNEKWQKEIRDNMGSDDKTEWRLTQLESEMSQTRNDIAWIKETLAKLVQKFDGYSPSTCGQHSFKLNDFEVRLAKVENSTESLTKTIIKWTAIGGVIVFLLGQVVAPYVLNHYKVSNTDNTAQVGYR